MSEAETASYEQALNTVEALYPAAHILAQASKKIQEPSVHTEDISSLINTDASLTTDIIRISNSAFYSFESESTNLNDAIRRIGFSEIIRLIGVSVSKELYGQNLKYYQLKHETYWTESVLVAMMMEALAVHCGENPQDAYTIGLLHAVGKIVLNQIMTDFEIEGCWDTEQSLDMWEREVIGFSYAYAGAMILKRWDFPTKVCHPILYQLTPPKKEMNWYLHACLYTAQIILEENIQNMGAKDLPLDELKTSMHMLGLEAKDLHIMTVRVHEKFARLKGGLNM